MLDRTLAWFRTLPLAAKTITIWALFAGIASIGLNLSAALDGELYGYTRIALGCLGIAGALTLLAGPKRATIGLSLLVAWSALQLPFIARTADGNLTKQVVDGLLAVAETVAVNGIVTHYTATGLNTMGILVTIVAVAAKRNNGLARRAAMGTPATP